MIQWSDKTTDICLVVNLAKWCPEHRVITIMIEDPQSWDGRRTGDTPSRAPAAKKAKRKEQ